MRQLRPRERRRGTAGSGVTRAAADACFNAPDPGNAGDGSEEEHGVRRLVRFVGVARATAGEAMEQGESSTLSSSETAAPEAVFEDDDRSVEELPAGDTLVADHP